jgi:hypothetical protein
MSRVTSISSVIGVPVPTPWVQGLQGTDLTQPSLRDAIGGLEGRDARLVGSGDHRAARVLDPRDERRYHVGGRTTNLRGDVDEAAGVGGVVGEVEDSALCKPMCIGGLGELVVRRPHDGGTPELRHRRRREDPPERARREHVALHRVDLVGRGDSYSELLCHRGRGARVCIGHRHAHAVDREPLDQLRADLADAHHRNVQALERSGPVAPLDRSAHRCEDTGGSGTARRTESAPHRRAARDERCLRPHHVDVGRSEADVFGGDVPAAEAVDEPSEHAEQRLGSVGGVADDHRLAAAEVEPRQRRLVGHRPGQLQDIGQGLRLGAVGPEPHPAECGTQRGRVDGDDRPQPGGRIRAVDHLFVAADVERAEHPRAGEPGRQRVETVADCGERAHAAIIPRPNRTHVGVSHKARGRSLGFSTGPRGNSPT